MRRTLKLMGANLAGQSGRNKGKAIYFFLRKETTTFTTPARDVIDAFWASHQGEVMGNIRSNFERKMRGERI